MRPQTRAGRVLRTGLTAAVTAAASMSFVVMAPPASASELLKEGFHSDQTTPGVWAASSPRGGDAPCLTAATNPPAGSLGACPEGKVDPVGQGVFRLTNDIKQAAGAVLLEKAIEAGRGVSIEFDLYMWGIKPYTDSLGPRGGDGISFYIVDGNTTAAQAGEPGGALGYKGLKDAFVGIGFDQFGNFSNPRWAGNGGPGVKPNSVVIRGSDSTGYGYIEGKELSRPLDDATNRDASKRHVLIDITPDNKMAVKIRHKDGESYETLFSGIDLDKLPNQDPLPKSIKVGFAASTGAATANHAISDLEIRALDADLQLAISNNGPFRAGGTGTYTINTAVNAMYGWADDPTRLTFEAPAGTTPTTASGTGWTCAIDGRKVTCDTDALVRPGDSFPQIKVDVAVADDASSTLRATGVVAPNAAETDAEVQPADNRATSDTTVIPVDSAPIGPDLSQAVGGDTTLTPGGTGTITVTTANASGAGPTTGTVKAVYTVPAPLQITGVTGDGWNCATEGRKVTCTRPGTGDDALKGGDSYPPVAIAVKVPAVTNGPVTVDAGVNTPGDSNTGNDTATGTIQLPVVDPAPSGTLDVKMTSNPKPYVPGKPYTYTVTVTNTGSVPVSGAQLVADWPSPWDRIKWTCTSTGGACPAASGIGDLNEVVSLAPGGSMTFTVVCLMPAGATKSYTATATVTAPNTNCTADKPCTSTDTNSPAQRRAA
ncbi:lectin-like domain-containing protein [Sinosporangium album]|nr:DUF11 domain-containing protein [Sinosporangium album]